MVGADRSPLRDAVYSETRVTQTSAPRREREAAAAEEVAEEAAEEAATEMVAEEVAEEAAEGARRQLQEVRDELRLALDGVRSDVLMLDDELMTALMPGLDELLPGEERVAELDADGALEEARDGRRARARRTAEAGRRPGRERGRAPQRLLQQP